ncbi:MAG TPA: hypothetical protein VFR18_08075, partial [Terriglobia bacterium]|nr:hypothetical protein [Terriglobia bacterium]
MVQLVSFKTSRFDVTQETPNESNAYAGESVLRWLGDELAKHRYESTPPDMEDWGWYIDVKGAGNSYLVGASAGVEYKDEPGSALSYDVTPNVMLDWTIQVHKSRTVMQKLLGKNKLAVEDPLCVLVERI